MTRLRKMKDWKIKVLAVLLTLVVFSMKEIYDDKRLKKATEVSQCE